MYVSCSAGTQLQWRAIDPVSSTKGLVNWITVVTHVQTQSPRSLPEMIGFNLAWIKLGASVAIVAPVTAYIVQSSPVHKPVTPARKAKLRSAHIEQLITWQFEYNVHCKVRASTMSTVSLQLIISCQLRM